MSSSSWFKPDDLAKVPKKPGVYIMKDADDRVLYVGKAKVLYLRLKQYFSLQDERKMVPILVLQISRIETIITFTEKEALILEANLIKLHKPKYNVLLKDDKTFIGIVLHHKHSWPRLELVRYRGKIEENCLYFGPYPSSHLAKEMFELLSKIFQLRQCNDKELITRTRPCILYSIKKCLAPCRGKCSKSDYTERVTGVIQFLKNQNKDLLEDLKNKMEEASEKLEYERAYAYLKTIRQIEVFATHTKTHVEFIKGQCDAIGYAQDHKNALIIFLQFRNGSLIHSTHFEKGDLFASKEELLETTLLQYLQETEDPPKEVYLPFELENQAVIEEIFQYHIKVSTPERGDKKKLVDMANENAIALLPKAHRDEPDEELLLHLKELLSLKNIPETIECFDTSNISGTDPVASKVVFIEGKKASKLNRLYKIRGDKGDDYSALKEVLKRRFEKLDLPDLLIIDGGKGQLNLAKQILDELNIVTVDLITISKEEGRHDKGLRKELIHLLHQQEPLTLSQGKPLFFLQTIRDEAHRVAIAFHRNRRGKRVIKSQLDLIEGIGQKKKALLFKRFKSIAEIKNASIAELMSIPLISEKDANNIKLLSQSDVSSKEGKLEK